LAGLKAPKKKIEPVVLVGSASLSDFIAASTPKDTQQVLRPLCEVAWPQPVTQNFISVPYPYPPAVFPIFAGILGTDMLKRAGTEADIIWFCETIAGAPLSPLITNEKRFVTYLLLFVLARALQPGFNLDLGAVDRFQQEFKPLVDEALNQYALPLVKKLDVHLNRFASTKFELEMLLPDWQKVLTDIKAAVGLPTGIKTFVFDHIIRMLDVRTANRLLSSPERLSFGHSVCWVSFLTALEDTIGQQFVITSEVCQAVQMGGAIARNPVMSNDICPYLSKHVVLFVLSHIVADEMFPETIDVAPFVREFELGDDGAIGTIAQPEAGDYMELVQGIRIQDWNACELSPELLVRFPHLAEFHTTS
jgi:hypothetical protein